MKFVAGHGRSARALSFPQIFTLPSVAASSPVINLINIDTIINIHDKL